MGTTGSRDVAGASRGKGAFMSVREVSELLDISQRTILRMCHEDQIGCIRVGSQWRIPRRQFFRRLGIDEDDL